MDKKRKIANVNRAILDFYQGAEISDRLVQAILYSVEAGGKRIRPLIFLDMLEALGLELEESHFQIAASVEMIHTGSLIHDDLPAMDNDDYRRGRLTNHKQFDEATAILAGDSLFLDPFGLLSEIDLPSEIKVRLIAELSKASGVKGMVAGQMLDILSEGQNVALEQLQAIHANKTGALLTFPFLAAGLVAQVPSNTLIQLRQVGELLGLAFQVRDDILDLTVEFDKLGKTPGKDLLAEKSTYPSLLGIEPSYQFLNQSLNQAQTILEEAATDYPFEPQSIQNLIESLRLHG